MLQNLEDLEGLYKQKAKVTGWQLVNKKTPEESITESKKGKFTRAKDFPRAQIKWEERCWYKYIPGNVSVWLKFLKFDFNTKIIDIEKVRKEIDKKQQEVIAISESADQGNPEKLKKNFTGIVFIVFKESRFMDQVLEKYKTIGKKRRCIIFGLDLCSCCQKKEVELVRAAEPTDVLWQNLGMSQNAVTCARNFSLLRCTALFFAAFGAMYGVNIGSQDNPDQSDDSKF